MAELTAAMGGEHIVVIPAMWRDDVTGEAVENGELTESRWADLFAGHNRMGKVLLEDFGLKQQFHSHADSHVGAQQDIETLLAATDPKYLNLCLDTGHAEYCGASSLELIKNYPDRIGYLHLKQINPDILEEGQRGKHDLGRGQPGRRDDRAAQRPAGPARRHRSGRGTEPPDLRHRGTGHVPGSLRRPDAHRQAHPQLPALLRIPHTASSSSTEPHEGQNK